MSLLKNPDFESGLQSWTQISGGPADIGVPSDTDKARTGSRYLRFRATTAQSSVGQDIQVTMPSVTALAYVRAESNNVSGSLAIWDLPGTPNAKKISAPFTVGQTWTQIVATSARRNPANGAVRIELYLDTTHAFIWIDSVNAF